MKKPLILFLSIIISSTISMTAWSVVTTFGGIEIEDTLSIDGNVLALKGISERKITLATYIIRLCLKGTLNNEDIVNADIPMALRFDFTSVKPGITLANLIQEDDTESNPDDKKEGDPAKKELIETICQILPDEIKQGDNIFISYTPDKGTSLWKNDKSIYTIPELSTKVLLFGNWIGEKSVNAKMKEELFTQNPFTNK